MVRLTLFLALVAMAVGAGLYLVSERRAICEAEGDVAALEREVLEKRQREIDLEARRARLKQVDKIRERIERSEKWNEGTDKQDNKDSKE